MSQKPLSPQQDALLHRFIDQMTDTALILLDAQGHVLGWRGACERIFGYSEEEMLGQSLERLFTEEDREMGIPAYEVSTAAQAGRAEDDRWKLRKDGSLFWAAGYMQALRGDDGEVVGFVKLVRDRSDVKGRIDALQNRVDALTRADERRRIFLGTLAHELRGPMLPLANALHLIRLAAPGLTALEYPVKLIGRQIDVLHRLVDDLMDFARLDRGKIALDFAPLDLGQALHDALEACRPLIERRRHSAEVLVPPQPITIEADAARIQQIVTNLITNAAKYTPDGGRIWIKATVEATEAVIRVEDTGIGIPAAMLPHVFDLFSQVETARGKSDGGLGLGLHVVKELVDLHGGTVQVRSEGKDQGSEFVVRLPLRRSSLAGA